jgi:sugar/nucleoside kinase (ribokinase family)
LIGMRVWSDSIAYFAAVGSDFAPEHRRQLERLGVDLRGLLVREGRPTARAWQLFEPDERRVEVFRTRIEDFYAMEARFEEMPPEYLRARGYQVHYGTLNQSAELARQLRDVNPTARLVWEPTPMQAVGTEEEFRTILGRIDVVTPDRDEARQMTGQPSVAGMIETLLAWGAPAVALRMGAEGSLLVTADGTRLTIPAAPATVVDTTGAGDAYCGGLLVALGEGFDFAEAGARAAVSASFAIEQFGVPTFDDQTRAEAERRLAWTLARVTG